MANQEITSYLKSIEEILVNTKEQYFIPEFQRNFVNTFSDKIVPGESIPILLIFKGKRYHARLNHIKFSDKNKRDKPTLQIAYNKKGGLPNALQQEFSEIYDYIQKGNNVIPEEMTRYLYFYTTEDLYTFEISSS